MICDVRKIKEEEILPLFRSLDKRANQHNCDVKVDTSRVYISLNWATSSFGEWKFFSSWEFQGEKIVGGWFEYYPPGGYGIRFDGYLYGKSGGEISVQQFEDIYKPALEIVNRWLVAYAGFGKNRISAFEEL